MSASKSGPVASKWVDPTRFPLDPSPKCTMQLHKQKEYHDPKLDVIEDQEFCSVEHEAEGSLLEVHSNIVKHDFDSTPLDLKPAIFACVIEPLT